jgi:HK97 gp10 family phage protein
MASTQYVTGLRETIRSLEKFGVDVADLKEVFTAIGLMVASDARRLAPIKTGVLASTIKPSKTKNKAAVRAGSKKASYAGMIQYGWPKRGIKAQPFLTTAIDSNKNKAISMMEEGLDDVITRHNLK